MSSARRLAGFSFWSLLTVLGSSAQNVRPTMLLLDGALSGSSVVAVGERGTVLISGDGGTSWRRAATPTRATLTGISFPAVQLPRRGWAVGHEAEILTSVDRGVTWTRQFQGKNRTDSFLDVLALDERTAIAVGAYGLFASTDDGGNSWSVRRIRDEDSHLNRISLGPTGKLYIAGEAGTLLRSNDRGLKWREIRTSYQGSFFGILPLGESSLLAYGLRGHVFRSEDDGATWRELESPAPALLATAVRLPGRGILLAGQARILLRGADDSPSLQPVATAPSTAIAELVDLGGGRFVALGEAGATSLTLP